MNNKVIITITGFHPIRTWQLKRHLKKWFGKTSPDQVHEMFRMFARKEGYTLTMEDGVEVYSNGKSIIRINERTGP